MPPSKLFSPIKSVAQLDMFTRVVADPDYAKRRGMDPAVATKLLSEHVAAGSPELPDRIGDKDKGPTPRIKKQHKPRGKLLGE